ncbi:MAG: adventurous gliding motility protein CglE [Anaeromyxobacteraceae bacterium]
MRLKAIIIAALLPSGALAQGAGQSAPPMPEDPRAPRYAEVERGLFTNFEVGWLQLFKTPVADVKKFPFAAAGGGSAGGFLVGASVGYDLTRHIALSVYGLGGNLRGNISYGAFSVFSAGGDLRASLIGARDRNEVERFYVYLHARGGLLVTQPTGLFGSDDVYLAGGPGIEYFTRLRHFSVGAAVDYAYVVKAKAPGLSVVPTVRYTF